MPNEIRNILIIVVARIGDTLLATPAIKALKTNFPNARLTVLAHPKRLELLRHLPFIDDLSGITKRSAPWRGRLGGCSFDLALVYGQDRALITYALRVSKKVVVFEQPGLPDSLKLVAVARTATPQHAVRERLMLADKAGARTQEFRLNYVVSADEKRYAEDWLAHRLPVGAKPLIGVQSLSFPTKPQRNWPLQSFAELIVRIRERYPQAHFLMLGDVAAAQQARELLKRFPQTLTIAAGETSLRQTAALIAELDLYIGVDTGPTHLAGALGVPMVALYHCAYPGRYLAPLEHPSCVTIEHPLTAQTLAVTPAMSDISVAEVWTAVRSLLDLPKTTPGESPHAAY